MQMLSNRFLSWAVALVAVPMLFFVAGCDGGGDDPENQSPSASFDVVGSTAGLTVGFASTSSDPDGQITGYSWDFDGDGNEDASGRNPTYTFAAVNTYDVTLTVTDDDGETATTSRSITAGTPTPRSSANYDTTASVITVSETDAGEGIVAIDENGDPFGDGSSVAWTSDFTYVLDGRVFVNDGQTLDIEAGTLIQGTQDRDPDNTGTLLVARGGTINANGTADSPIVFAAQGDDDPNSFTTGGFDDRGFWGGLLLLGSAPNNLGPAGSGASGTNTIEGFTADPRATYGCGDEGFECDEDDSSGTLRYVSIRNGGFELSEGNEINGLTMGSVGAGTTLEYIEVVSNLDDGFEWFGGTVNATHLVSSFVGDDSFDIDQGFNGDLQYLLAVQGFDGGDRGGEHDSGDSGFGGEDSEPVARSQVCNATYIGYSDGDVALKLRDNFGGSYYNSIFTNFPTGMVEIEDTDGGDALNEFNEGNLRIENNLAFGFPGGNTWSDLVENDDEEGGSDIADYLADNNTLLDGELAGFSLSYDDDGDLSGLDLFPDAGSEASSDADGSNCMENTGYKGAFEPGGDNWADGWTTLSQSGLLGDG
jgi:PKD repeat protein